MKENKLVDLSMDFSVKVIKLCENIKGHYSLVNQLERSATSIGANIHEANYAHGKPDLLLNFKYRSKNVMKLNIGLNYLLNQVLLKEKLQKNYIISAVQFEEF